MDKGSTSPRLPEEPSALDFCGGCVHSGLLAGGFEQRNKKNESLILSS